MYIILVKFPYYMEPTWFHIMTFGHPWPALIIIGGCVSVIASHLVIGLMNRVVSSVVMQL